MKHKFKLSLFAASLIASASAYAVQQDITVSANIDPTVAITQADGSALPASVVMPYMPGKGLGAYRNNVKFWSNSEKSDLNVSLASAPSLVDETGGNAIPLSVTINGEKLSTTAAVFPFATTFPAGIGNGSAALPLIISQSTPGAIANAGNYSGIVSLVVTQAAAANGE